MLKKAYAKLTRLRRLKRLVPINTLLVLYKSFELLHFEYRNSLLIGVNMILKKELEDDNHYGLGTIMNIGKKILIMSLFLRLKIWIHLNTFFKCFKENGSKCIMLYIRALNCCILNIVIRYLLVWTWYSKRNWKMIIIMG